MDSIITPASTQRFTCGTKLFASPAIMLCLFVEAEEGAREVDAYLAYLGWVWRGVLGTTCSSLKIG